MTMQEYEARTQAVNEYSSLRGEIGSAQYLIKFLDYAIDQTLTKGNTYEIQFIVVEKGARTLALTVNEMVKLKAFIESHINDAKKRQEEL